MTWTQVGNFATAPTGGIYNTNTFPITTGGIGNLLVFINTLHSDTGVYPTGVSSSRVTWAKVSGTDIQDQSNTNANIAAPQTWSGNIWFGTVNSVGSDTVTCTWTSGTPAHVNGSCQEFHTDAGLGWSMEQWTFFNNASGQSAWPAMTPAHSGELYMGYAWNSSNSSAPSPNPDSHGYIYQPNAENSVNLNGGAINLAVPTGSATGPVWADSTETYGMMILVQEGSGTVTPGPDLAVRQQVLLPYQQRVRV